MNSKIKIDDGNDEGMIDDMIKFTNEQILSLKRCRKKDKKNFKKKRESFRIRQQYYTEQLQTLVTLQEQQQHNNKSNDYYTNMIQELSLSSKKNRTSTDDDDKNSMERKKTLLETKLCRVLHYNEIQVKQLRALTEYHNSLVPNVESNLREEIQRCEDIEEELSRRIQIKTTELAFYIMECDTIIENQNMELSCLKGELLAQKAYIENNNYNSDYHCHYDDNILFPYGEDYEESIHQQKSNRINNNYSLSSFTFDLSNIDGPSSNDNIRAARRRFGLEQQKPSSSQRQRLKRSCLRRMSASSSSSVSSLIKNNNKNFNNDDIPPTSSLKTTTTRQRRRGSYSSTGSSSSFDFILRPSKFDKRNNNNNNKANETKSIQNKKKTTTRRRPRSSSSFGTAKAA